MPPFVSTECPHCKHQNRFDLAELKKTNAMMYKKITRHYETNNDEEYSVTCSHCGRKFKFTVKGGKDG